LVSTRVKENLREGGRGGLSEIEEKSPRKKRVHPVNMRNKGKHDETGLGQK